MKKINFFLLLGSFSFLFIPSIFAFTDTNTSWYTSFIEAASEQKYIQGYEDGSFRPDIKITREEFLKILFQVSEKQVETDILENCFSDVHDEMWSKKYICSAKSLGITSGYEDATFRPYNTITTIEALAFIARMFEFEIGDTETEWFENYRIFFSEKSIFEWYLYTKNTLLSRGQATELLVRSAKYKQEESFENLSAWCGLSEIPDDTGDLEIAGKNRKYILSLPSGYNPNTSYPLIFWIHGRTNSNAMVQDYMKLEKYPEGAIVVYPAGLWSGPYTWHESENIEYFDALLSKLSHNYCIKRNKVFLVGHSLGGYMTYKLGCLRGNIIRAISVVWGSSYAGECEYPVATQILHRPDDHLVPYTQGKSMLTQFQKINLCSSEIQNLSLWNIAQSEYICSPQNPVVFGDDYSTYLDDPHSWPKGGSDFASDFFESLE
jgi:polyhydroxybutyrate depolymerase